MKSFFFSLFILYLIYPISPYSIFAIQETLTISCDQFPLVSTANNSDLQCARLRIDETVSMTDFNLDRPTQIILFIIVDQLSSQISPIDITISFNQSSGLPSSINEIRVCLFVTYSNYTINNQTTTLYAPYSISIFNWNISTEDTYDLIDLLQLGNQDYVTDTSLCSWSSDRWNRLFNQNTSINVPYVYFLKTTNPQLTFTLIDTSSKSLTPSAPPPYVTVLYCVPYKLGVTEMVLIICFCVLFLAVAIILGILHYLKGGEDNRTRHFERYHHRGTQDKFIGNHSKKIRHRPSASTSGVEQDEHTLN